MKKEDVERILKPVAERYHIKFAPERLEIYEPAYMSIPYEKIERIEERPDVFDIQTPISSIGLWKDTTILHHTYYWETIQEAIKAKEELEKKRLSEVVP
jgi:hypothetical protein